MKVYVNFNDLDAEDMPSHICNKYVLNVRSTNGGSIYNNVELVNLADYTKQVRKEVVEQIKDLAGNYFELPYCDNCGETNNDDVVLTGNDLTEILDQIEQGEAK